MASRPVCKATNIAERHLTSRSTKFEGIGNVVGLRRAIDQTELLNETGVEQLAEWRTGKNLASGKGRIARNQSGSIEVHDGHFIDQEGVTNFGINQ